MSEPRRFGGLHVLADDDPRWSRDPVEQAAAACRGGASVIQLRAKHATDALTLEWARAIRELTRRAGAHFVLNDRLDLAVLAQADAVHLGQDDLPASALPPEIRARLAVGRSTHDLAQARAAVREEVDYVAFGPVFETGSKKSEYAARGLEQLREIATIAGTLPVVAIGGIDAKNAADVARAGAAGIAVISAVAGASNPQQAATELARAFSRGGRND